MAKQYGLHFPQVADSSKGLYKYSPKYPSIGLPLNIAIDLRTMKLVYAKSGAATLTTIANLATQTLDSP